MDEADQAEYATAMDQVKTLVRLHSEGNVHIEFLDFLNTDDSFLNCVLHNLVKDVSILPELKTRLATRWTSSKALQEVLEDRPLDRNIFKKLEREKRGERRGGGGRG